MRCKYLILFFVVVCNCFLPKEISYQISLRTGVFEITYFDFRSDAANDATLSNDYRTLKNAYDSVDITLHKKRYKVLSKKLFPENNTLNCRLTVQSRQTDSTQGIITTGREFLLEGITLTYANQKYYLENNNRKVFFICKTNGKLTNRSLSQSVVWKKKDRVLRFHVVIREDAFNKSLLDYYLQESF